MASPALSPWRTTLCGPVATLRVLAARDVLQPGVVNSEHSRRLMLSRSGGRSVSQSSPAKGSITSRQSQGDLVQRSSPTFRATAKLRPLQRIPTSALLRTIFLSSVFARPLLSSVGMAALQRIAESRSPILDPDRNWLLNRVIRATVYNQFCAGTEPVEISRVVRKVKNTGASGVIINYAREIVAHQLAETDPSIDVSAQQIQSWFEGNVKSLSCIDSGDYLAIKPTGAGGKIVEALKAGNDPPAQYLEACHRICEMAKERGIKVMVDAEQQIYQETIDRWVVDLMRRFNKDGTCVVLNTYQTYLKGIRAVLREHLQLASKEGWALGIKQVRGAYILNEIRDRIHDTKADTDRNYNTIAQDLLKGSFDGLEGERFPKIQLFLAGHNAESVRLLSGLIKDLVREGKAPHAVEFGQLYGMADHVSGELIAEGVKMQALAKQDGEKDAILLSSVAPKVVKCINWGSVRECLYFLMRRAAENQGSTDRLHDGLAEAKRELRARLSPWRAFQRSLG